VVCKSPHFCSFALRELCCISKQRRSSASVPEQHILFRHEFAFTNQIDQACHGPARVDRIDQQSLGLCAQTNGLAFRLTQHGIAAAQVMIVHFESLAVKVKGVPMY